MTNREAIKRLSGIRDSEYIIGAGLKRITFNEKAIEAFDLAIAALEKQEQDKWISCKERLPEEYGEYRITWKESGSDKTYIADSEFEPSLEWDDEHDRFKGEWLLDDYIKAYPDVEVIAWKPIEEPYTEEES